LFPDETGVLIRIGTPNAMVDMDDVQCKVQLVCMTSQDVEQANGVNSAGNTDDERGVAHLISVQAVQHGCLGSLKNAHGIYPA